MTMSWQDVYTVLKFVLVVAAVGVMVGQCRKPNGWIGGRVARAMNIGHASLTRWGLGHVAVGNDFTMLDVGCGGGKLIDTLASIAPAGRLFGIDYSRSSVETARATNAARIAGGRVDIRLGTVSQLPFDADTFDLVTAFETHYYWPDLPRDVAEIARVLKPGGIFLLVAEAYRGQRLGWLFRPAMAMLGGKYLTVAQHRELFVNAGFTDISVDADPAKGWISVRGTKAGAANVGEAYS
jgi:SAM-dependent methyltransferase